MLVTFDRREYVDGWSIFDLLGWVDWVGHYDEWKPRYYSIVGYDIAAPQSARVDLIINADIRIQTAVGMTRFPIKLPAQCANHGQYYIHVHADVPSITLELELNDLSQQFDIGHDQPIVGSFPRRATYCGTHIYFDEYMTFIDGVIQCRDLIKI